ELLFVTFDREVAYVYGIRVEWIDSLLSLILAAAIIVSMQTLGVTLIAAALVIPPITARLLTDNFGKMMLVSALVGALCAAAGMYLSFLVDMASGAAIVLVLAGLFVGVLAFRSIRDRGRALVIPPGDIRELYE
ncbi:MAG TPA: metal ABC transporter permease, partial [Anaerolineae bacterium]